MSTSAKRTRCSVASLTTNAYVMNKATKEPTVLAAVLAVVSRERKEIAGLLHATRSISDFLDEACDRWTFENALGKAEAQALEVQSLVRLLDRLLARECSELDPNVRMGRFLHGVALAFTNRNMQIVDWWLTKYMPLNQATAEYIMERAVDYNRIHVLELLEQKGVLPPPLEKRMVECCHAEVAYWLYVRGYLLSIAVEHEIRQNNLDFMKWIHEHEDIRTRGLAKGIALAADVNSVDMARWLNEAYSETEWKQPFFRRNYTGMLDLTMIKWLEANFLWDDLEFDYSGFQLFKAIGAHDQWVNAIIRYTAKNGQLDIVQYLYSHYLHESNGAALYDAARSGHFEVVKWFHQQNPEFSRAGIEYAATNGHFDVVKWLHNEINGTEHDKPGLGVFYELSIDKAAWSGSLEMVQWLHHNRTEECSTNAMHNAAVKGHLAILQFLHANRSEGCTPEAFEGAVYNGHLEVVQWLLGHRSE